MRSKTEIAITFLALSLMGWFLTALTSATFELKNLYTLNGYEDSFIIKLILLVFLSIVYGCFVYENIKSLFVNLKAAKKESKSTPSGVFYPEELKGSGVGTFPEYIRQKYFLALCLMYPNLGGTLQEIQAVGLGQQPELSDNCRSYIQGFMRALMDSRGSPLPVEALVQANAFVIKLLIDTDVLKSFVKDFKDNIEETIELIVNSNQEY